MNSAKGSPKLTIWFQNRRANMRLDTIGIFAILAILARFCAEYDAALSSSDWRWVGPATVSVRTIGAKLAKRWRLGSLGENVRLSSS